MTVTAFEQAVTFLGRTDLIPAARLQVLPVGVTELLKISSGDQEVTLHARERYGLPQEDIRHAAEFYVQQILFAPDADYYRVLGVDPDDAETKIKLHQRLLLRWLHPDKNPSDWEVVFSERVNRAWNALRTPVRRRAYDEQLSTEPTKAITGHAAPNTIKPVHWRDGNNDASFVSTRTIQRLPIAVFSLLAVGALLTLLWFSQMQPVLQIPNNDTANVEASNLPASATSVPEPPATSVAKARETFSGDQVNSIPESSANTVIQEKPETRASEVAVQTRPEAPDLKIPALAVSVKVPVPMASVRKPEVAEKKSTSTPAVAAKPALASNTKAGNELPSAKVPVPMASVRKPEVAAKKSTSIPTVATKPNLVSETKAGTKLPRKDSMESREMAVEKAVTTQNGVSEYKAVALTNNISKVQPELTSDASVKQFLKQFSRVYAEGDYFALHKMFTNDLSILSAPSQRTVLRSYRELFENSDSREIALDHVTWLTTDEHIVVIASYQAQVVPRGKDRAKSSQGDIRMDIRVENGQLRIIGLQSDSKNG